MADAQRTDGKKGLNKQPTVRSRTWAIVLSVSLGAIGVSYWTSRTNASAAVSAETRVQSTLHLETFVLNLAGVDQRSYLRVGIDLGLNCEPKRGEESVPVAEVRDTILSVLAEARGDSLTTAEGKTKLKESVLHALQQRVPRLGVEEVYFTEFLIQR